jgi:hypothetical protein
MNDEGRLTIAQAGDALAQRPPSQQPKLTAFI